MEMVIGETVLLLVGGAVYFTLLVRHGAFNRPAKGVNRNYTRISAACAGGFSLIMALFMYFQNAAELGMILLYALIFFAAMTVVGWLVLTLLGKASDGNGANEKKRP